MVFHSFLPTRDEHQLTKATALIPGIDAGAAESVCGGFLEDYKVNSPTLSCGQQFDLNYRGVTEA